MQVLRMGPAITGLSLAPGQELLATTHANLRGIYLWANQAIFGKGAPNFAPSDVPVNARLPTLAAGVPPFLANWLRIQQEHQSLMCSHAADQLLDLACTNDVFEKRFMSMSASCLPTWACIGRQPEYKCLLR